MKEFRLLRGTERFCDPLPYHTLNSPGFVGGTHCMFSVLGDARNFTFNRRLSVRQVQPKPGSLNKGILRYFIIRGVTVQAGSGPFQCRIPALRFTGDLSAVGRLWVRKQDCPSPAFVPHVTR